MGQAGGVPAEPLGAAEFDGLAEGAFGEEGFVACWLTLGRSGRSAFAFAVFFSVGFAALLGFS